jgi:hypothetical protein
MWVIYTTWKGVPQYLFVHSKAGDGRMYHLQPKTAWVRKAAPKNQYTFATFGADKS